jgi:hypothetical protein
MFLGHIEPGAAVQWINQRSWLSLEDCMRIACVDKANMGIIRLTRYYPIISDEVLQKVWGAYIEKKNECVEIDKRLNELNISLDDEIQQLSLGLRFLSLCPSSISNQLQRYCPSTRESFQAIEKCTLPLSSRLLKDEVTALREQFLEAREEVYILELVGGRQKYEQLPVHFENIGIFEEFFKLCKDKYLQEIKEMYAHECCHTDDRALFLFAVSMELCRRAARDKSKDINDADSPLAPFFEAVPDLIPKALEMLKGIEISEMKPFQVVIILGVVCQPAPVMRDPMKLSGRSIPALTILIKNTTTDKITVFCISRMVGGWRMSTPNGQITHLFTQTGEKTESYNWLSDLMIKKRLTEKGTTYIVLYTT